MKPETQADFSSVPPYIYRELLKDVDDHALSGVMHGGKPFAASLVLYEPDKKNVQMMGYGVDKTLYTGIPSMHAEDDVFRTDVVSTLSIALADYRNAGNKGATVIITSNSQSCAACHAKQEIFARRLRAEGFEIPVVVNYGATLQQTAEVTGFNYEPYLLEMFRQAGNFTLLSTDQAVKRVPMARIPEAVRQVIGAGKHPAAVVARGSTILSQHAELFNDLDLRVTPETKVLGSACAQQLKNGVDKPGDLSRPGAEPTTLFTTADEVGPMVRAEALLCGVERMVMVGPRDFSRTHHEAPGISNGEFFKVIARSGYNGSGAMIQVVRDATFKNAAQIAWATGNAKGSQNVGASSLAQPSWGLGCRLRKEFSGVPLP